MKTGVDIIGKWTRYIVRYLDFMAINRNEIGVGNEIFRLCASHQPSIGERMSTTVSITVILYLLSGVCCYNLVCKCSKNF